MLERLQNELLELKTNPPWRLRTDMRISEMWEGVGAPEPGEFQTWKNKIRALQRTIGKVAEEDARKQINRP